MSRALRHSNLELVVELATWAMQEAFRPTAALLCTALFEVTLQEPRLQQERVHFIWLAMAQNLGRVCQEGEHQWCPDVRITTQVPERLKAVGTHTHDLLSRAVEHNRLPIRPRLYNWLCQLNRCSAT